MSSENHYGVHQAPGTGHYPPHPHPVIAHHPSFSSSGPASGATLYGYREDQQVSFGTPPVAGEMMAEVVGGTPVTHPGQQPYGYPEQMDPSQRPAPPPGQAQWQVPYYGGAVSMPGPENDPSGRPMVPDASPISPHHATVSWDRSRGTSFSRPPSQDSNGFPPHHNSVAPSQSQKYGQPALNRTIEPNAAPSPPTQYPGSPRTPLPQHMGPPTPGLPPPHQQYRPQSGQRTSLSMSATSAPHPDGPDPRSYMDQQNPSPLRSPMDVPRHVNGGIPFAPPGPPPQQSSYTHHRQGSYGEHRPELRHRHSSDGRVYNGDPHAMGREHGSRVPSASMSPSSSRMVLGEVESSPSTKIENGEGPKKKGAPAFQDPVTGIEYYENEPVPPDVMIPSGWQRGNGKHTQDLLLPLVKDGIPVNPEWGFTAGGKARQRLPAACVNCRQKKIKCVELEYDESICQHCMKMRIPCTRPTKEEEKKKKSRPSLDKTKSDGGRSTSIGSIGSVHVTLHNLKKRKSSMEPVQDSKKANRRTISRAGSMSRDHGVDTQRANQYMPVHSPVPHSAPPLVGPDGRPPPFPTLENGVVPHQSYADPDDSRARHVMELRKNNFGPPMGYPDASPQSYPPSSPSISGASTGGVVVPYHQNAPSAPSVHSYQSKSDSRGSGSHQERGSTPHTTSVTSPTAGTPLCKELSPNSRSKYLPPPAQLEMLVNTYFEHFYSQTYAFLHKPSFITTLHEQPEVLLLSICAVAARFTKDISPQAAEVWAKATRELILEMYATYTIEVVQSMVHMGIHDFGTNNGQKAWIFAGMAIRMGSALNMNLENHKKDLTTVEKEVYRRTYWAYYLMDRFNSYGVARPYMIQDHDCHIQLPCNQPCFEEGEKVGTELLEGPNPNWPNVGTKYMGAFAFLVRITCIWGNILRQIHFLTLKKERKADTKAFDDFISKLEKWRTSLPPGLAYSNENLAGQVKVGTTGAFVMMHVMWHMAMAYVYRYIRIGSAKLNSEDESQKIEIVESIRRAFIHADAILQIMVHVRQRRDAPLPGEKPVIVNAPFLGQAIYDACHITVTRALEVRHEHGGAREQKARVVVGLAWLRELKRFWGPINDQYKRIKKIVRQLNMDPSSNPQLNSGYQLHQAPTPESSAGSAENRDHYMQANHNVANWMPPSNGMAAYDPTGVDALMATDYYNGGVMMDTAQTVALGQFSDFLSIPVPQQYYGEAFNQDSHVTLHNYAAYESGFPDLYPVVTTTYSDPSLTAHHQMSPPGLQTPHQPFPSQLTQIDDASDDDDDAPDARGHTSGGGGGRDIHTTYFDPGAVHDGKLQDSASDSSGRSRRPSEAGPAAKSGPTNRMDVLNLINSTGVENRVAEALPQRYKSDKFTGSGGTIVPESNRESTAC